MLEKLKILKFAKFYASREWAKKGNILKISIKLLTEIAMLVALSAILGMIVLYRPPQGGTVTAAMLPIIVLALRRGTVIGVIGGVLAGTLQMALDPFFVHPLQVLLDYQIAWGAIGLAGLIPKLPLYSALLGIIVRFLAHSTSGFIFFAQFAPEGSQVGFPLVVYVALYNATYLVPSAIIIIVFLLVLKKNPLLGRLSV